MGARSPASAFCNYVYVVYFAGRFYVFSLAQASGRLDVDKRGRIIGKICRM